jgi:glycosyltransferase involved in cell wall biosynthesis
MKEKDIPLVSVVIPTYNRSHVLNRAVQSVLLQTLSNFEIIIVNDGSTDATVDCVNKLLDRRIRFINLQQNYGASYARNIGIIDARAELVAFLDSDDEWHPTKLESQLALLNVSSNPDVSIVYCLHDTLVNRSGTLNISSSTSKIYEGNIYENLLKGGYESLTTSTLLIKRSSLIKVGGFDPSLPSFQDPDLLLRLAEAGNHFLAVNEILVVKHRDTQQLSISDNLIAKSEGFEIFQHRWSSIIKNYFDYDTYYRWYSKQSLYLRILQIKKAIGNNNKFLALYYVVTALQFFSFSRYFIDFLLLSFVLIFVGQGKTYQSMYKLYTYLFR